MPKWSLFVYAPIWIEESGLPEKITAAAGAEGCLLFRKLVEIDTDRNLVPDWFSITPERISRWTGIPGERIDSLLEALDGLGLVHREPMPGGWRVRICCPLPIPVSPAEVRERLRFRGLDVDRFRLRYLEGTSPDDYGRLLELYQSVFGTRINAHIAEELRELSETFEWPAIQQAFEETKSRKRPNMTAILNHLYKELRDEALAESFRDAGSTPLPGGYHFRGGGEPDPEQRD